MVNADAGRIRELLRLLDECGGDNIERALGSLAMSFRSFDVNAAVLVREIHAFESAFPNPLMTVSRRRDLFVYSYEIVRLFQNTIAAGQSYIEHSLTSVRRRYRKHAFQDEFEAEHRRALTAVPICQFVMALRHFQLHNQAISPSVSRSLMGFGTRPNAMCQILLSTHGLEAERDDWKRKKYVHALEYLDGLGSSIDVADLVEDYRQPLVAFRKWHRTRERELNADALARAAGLRAEITKLDPVVGSYLVCLDTEDEQPS